MTSVYLGDSLSLEVGEDGIADLRFDLRDATVNKLNARSLGELEAAVSALQGESGVNGLLLGSAKDTFIVGADISEFRDWLALSDAGLAERLLQVHRLFAAIEDLPFPTVALINGLALGGGLELALAADFRVMADQTRVGLPEIKLGIFPGWGGTIRLPRLIGLDNAIEWIGTGSEQDARAALSTGAVEAATESGELRAAALALIYECQAGKRDYRQRRLEKCRPVRLNETERRMAFTVAKSYLAAKAGPHYPAPMAALKAMESHAALPRDEAARVESEAFVHVVRTAAAGNLVGLYLNEQALKREAKRYAGSAIPVRAAAVVGAGIMGAGIACQAALKGVPVVMKDVDSEALAEGLAQAGKLLAKRVERGRMDSRGMGEVLNRIDPAHRYDELAGAGIAIEAVVESAEVKKTVLMNLEQVMAADAIIASNTSTISISGLAGALRHPERFCGMHFFNPVHAMPLVEVIRGEKTDDVTVATTVAFARAIGKHPVVVNDCPGFLVNRVLFPYFNGFELLLRDGADFRHVDRVMEQFGWPMGPAYLLDVVGIDTAHHAARVLAEGYPDRMQLAFESATSVFFEQGRLGQKSGSGYYRYARDRKGRIGKQDDDQASQIVSGLAAGAGHFDDQSIVERMMVPLCLEAVRCLEEAVAESAAVVDMGLVWGIGFPPFLGGALRYIDTVGAAAFCDLADKYGHLGGAYRPSTRLREMAEQHDSFFS